MSAAHLRKCPACHYYEMSDGIPNPFRCPACSEISALRRSLKDLVIRRDALESEIKSLKDHLKASLRSYRND